jgi:hypothetical protein
MNISKETIETLKKFYLFGFYDDNINAVSPDKATQMCIHWELPNHNNIGKTIKATKKELTLDNILSKINSDKVYTNFCKHFNKLISDMGTAYATSYGIGFFVALDGRKSIENTKQKIESVLTQLGIKFSTEYSDAGWVFRYKISKSFENIQKIEALI